MSFVKNEKVDWMILIVYAVFLVAGLIIGYSIADNKGKCNFDIDGFVSYYDSHVGSGDLRFVNNNMTMGSVRIMYDKTLPYSRLIAKHSIEGFCK